jgi:hypothetical protein
MSPALGEVSFMSLNKSIRVLLVVSVLLVSVTAKTQKMRRIATGVWGGEHINMKVGAKSATIEYDCATGVIAGPLVVDRSGHFSLRGTHKMERGGPVRLGDEPKPIPATYTGSIKGNTMTLTLKLAGADDETFTLEKGKTGELFKCK